MESVEAASPAPFGKYLLDREIARGGMARVYVARLRGLGGFEKRLVVKQILPNLARDPRFVSMFVEEAKTLVQMSHPHIVPVYELGVVDGVYFLAMEYVEGATLAEILEEGPLDPAQAAHVAMQICEALSYAHERFAIVHRDVTPRNVIIDEAGHCRLLDFGIAAPASEDSERELFGTPGYLSPEQARGEPIEAASDLFSLGAVMHHALIGIPPFDPRDIESVRALLPGSSMRSIALLPGIDGALIDSELASWIDRLLDPDPGSRPKSARSLARSFRGWLSARHPEGVAPELGQRADRARQRRRTLDHQKIELTTGSVRREPTGKIQTLAQSRALEAMIEGRPLPERISITPEEARTSQPELGATKKLSRDSDAGARASSPGTTPLAGRSGRHQAIQLPASRTGSRWWLASLLGIAAAAIAIATIATQEPPRPERHTAIAEPPHAERSAETQTTATPEGRAEAEDQTVAETVPAPVPVRTPDPDSASISTPSARRATLAVTVLGGWAAIAIDGRSIGTTPIARAPISVGSHTLTAENDALGRRAEIEFNAEPGKRLHAIVDLNAARIAITER